MVTVLIITIIVLLAIIGLLLYRLKCLEPIGAIIADEDNSFYIRLNDPSSIDKMKHSIIVSFKVLTRK